MIVIAFPTVQDGLVLRWYANETAAERGDDSMSASRNGVLINGYLHHVPEEYRKDAEWAHEQLSWLGRDRRDEIEARLVTHRRKRFMGREIEPVERAEATS